MASRILSPVAGRLENQIVVITGSGIGEGIARLFAGEGASLVISDLNGAWAEAVAAGIADDGGRVVWKLADVRKENDCRQLIEYAIEVWGGIDVLVNNAGVSTRGNIENTPTEAWDNIFATNVRGPFICIQQAVRYMKERQWGSIINIGSVNAYIGEPKLMAYSASRGALMTLTKNTASYLNRYRIRVNQLNVGWTLTSNEHAVKLQEGRGERWVEDATRSRPFGRMWVPRDIGLAALYFASQESECITGAVLDLEQYPVGAPPDF